GWALDGETEVFDVATFVENFDIVDVQKAGAVFDPEKFKWLAGDTIRRMSVPALADAVAPFVVRAGLMDDAGIADRRDWFERLVAGEQERIELFSELPPRIAHFFGADDAVEYDPKAEKGARKHEARVETLRAFGDWLAAQPTLDDSAALADAAKAWASDRGLKLGALFQPLRCVLTGQAGGRDLFDAVSLLGKESALARIAAGVRRLA
ncbi:MAG: hypothetical protein AAFP86_16650, partial [Planctomycetota bacterium]